MRIETDPKLGYEDVLIRPKRSTLGSRKKVDLTRKFSFRNYLSNTDIHYDGIPIMAANMDGVGTIPMAQSLSSQQLFTCLIKSYDSAELTDVFTTNSNLKESTAMSIGITSPELEKFASVKKEVGTDLKYICVDVANGYSERFVDFISALRDDYADVVIIAGNVVTADQTQELLLNGADIIKVGIGPGSVCTTRIKTGVGYPQLSAVIECSDAAHGLNGHIIADGGCVFPGDVVKAFAGGADFVMIGGMLAGHNEGGGDVVTKYHNDGEYILDKDTNSYTPAIKPKSFVEFYGMSSKTANEKHFGGLKDYRSSEGRTALVPYRGEVEETVQDILGGIRSACTYVGARKLKQLSKCTTFVTTARQYNTRYEESTIGD